MRTAKALLLAALVGGCSTPNTPTTTPTDVAPAPAESALLQPIMIDELERIIADQKGNVVVLDIWFLGCAPCVKKFPSFVELHNLYDPEGLVCMSVDVEIDEIQKMNNVLDFLKAKHAVFRNFIIADTVKNRDAWQAKNDANATPSYVVYNRKGERVPVPQSIKPEEMKQLVEKLLDAK